MDDLVELNLRIAQHNMGGLDQAQRDYLQSSSSCLARLTPTAEEMQKFLQSSSQSVSHENPLDVVSLNREYLNFVRLMAKDIIAGHTEKLVMMGLDWGQVELVAGLTNQKISQLAIYWPGLIFTFATTVVAQGARLHPSAAFFHATAH